MSNSQKTNDSASPLLTGKHMLAVVAAMLIVAYLFFAVTYVATIQNVKRVQTIAYGKSIASIVEQAMATSDMTASVIENLYIEFGDEVGPHFEAAAQRIMEQDRSISSVYIAPKGVIQYAYPTEVAASTIGFAMLEDPDQGPSARKAVTDRATTVAGPHALIEGGAGFICRRPLFNADGSFRSFVIIVYDWDRVIENVTAGLPTENSPYSYGIWKEDEHVLVDGDGFIYRNSSESISREVSEDIHVPNDVWHLAIQPAGGWNLLGDTLPGLALGLALALVVFAVAFVGIRSAQRREVALREAAANRAKSAFLFSMSHDIRTPMNAIIGFTELAKKSVDDPKKTTEYLGKIRTSSDYLLDLVNNVLELARIESGKVAIEEALWDARAINDEIAVVFEESFKAKDLTFERQVECEHTQIFCDGVKMKEIFLNLLSNALKYTPEGGTVTMLTKELPCDKPGYAIFHTEVADTGIGMAADFLPHLFEDFTREHTSTESSIIGTGLGMPIVKQLVEMMGGTITVESELGKGTKFTVELPHRLATKDDLARHRHNQDDAADSHTSLAGKRVLMAEDNDLNAEIAEAILTEAGLEVERAVDGVECVATIKAAEAGHYDAILMDIQMPNMDGYTATRTIRTLADPVKASIPIIAMTANAFEEDKRKAFEAGMNDHVAKPIDVEKLLAALRAAL